MVRLEMMTRLEMMGPRDLTILLAYYGVRLSPFRLVASQPSAEGVGGFAVVAVAYASAEVVGHSASEVVASAPAEAVDGSAVVATACASAEVVGDSAS